MSFHDAAGAGRLILDIPIVGTSLLAKKGRALANELASDTTRWAASTVLPAVMTRTQKIPGSGRVVNLIVMRIVARRSRAA